MAKWLTVADWSIEQSGKRLPELRAEFRKERNSLKRAKLILSADCGGLNEEHEFSKKEGKAAL